MPWIHVTLPHPVPERTDLADSVAGAAAAAAGLAASDVVVLVSVAAEASSAGALVVLAGRRRSPEVETALAQAVAATVAREGGLAPELVGVVRA